MTELDFESDTFLTLLTEALRSGPGSPSWHQAVRQLREGGIEHADDYQMLVTAREHLESGKGYRAVRAGPLFTQRLMSRIEDESAAADQRPRTTMAIALACAAAMLVAVLSVGYLLKSASESAGDESEGTQLLVNTIASLDTTAGSNPQWRAIGHPALKIGKGSMSYATEPANAAGGAGLVWNESIAADEPFVVTATLRARRAVESIVPQIFITDEPQFSEDNSISPHEFVWLMRANKAQVILPNGRVDAQKDFVRDRTGNIFVRVTIDHDQATVSMSGVRIWTGPSLLDDSKPRYVGIRFLRRSGEADETNLVFQSVRINTRQK